MTAACQVATRRIGLTGWIGQKLGKAMFSMHGTFLQPNRLALGEKTSRANGRNWPKADRPFRKRRALKADIEGNPAKAGGECSNHWSPSLPPDCRIRVCRCWDCAGTPLRSRPVYPRSSFPSFGLMVAQQLQLVRVGLWRRGCRVRLRPPEERGRDAGGLNRLRSAALRVARRCADTP